MRKQLNKQVVEFFVDATQKVEETHEMPKNEEIREPEKLPADEGKVPLVNIEKKNF